MSLLFAAFTLVVYVSLFLAFTRYSFLAIDLKAAKLGGAAFLFYNLVFIFPAMFLIPLIGPENIRVLYFVQPESLTLINALIAYSLILFVLVFSFTARLFGSALQYDSEAAMNEALEPSNQARLLTLNRVLMLSVPAILIFSEQVLGGRHALIAGLLDGLNAGSIRHENENTPFVSYIKHYFSIISMIMVLVLATPVYRGRHIERLLVILAIVLGVTAHGSKSPLVMLLILYAFLHIENRLVLDRAQRNRAAMLRLLLRLSMWGAFAITFFVAFIFFFKRDLLHFDFWDYFWNRAFIGQMAGMYEQFNLYLQDIEYVSHAIPFANFFGETSNFHKDLMLITENRIDPRSIGIKITLFPAEAYAFFGWIGVIVAPAYLALQYCLNYLVISQFFKVFLFRAGELPKRLAAFFFAGYFALTDGLAEMFMFKSLILIMIMLIPVGVVMAIRGTWVLHRPRSYV